MGVKKIQGLMCDGVQISNYQISSENSIKVIIYPLQNGVKIVELDNPQIAFEVLNGKYEYKSQIIGCKESK